MNDAYYTGTNGERADLAAIEVNPPEGYIGTRIMPIVPVTEKTGSIYYATVTADAAADTARSVGAGSTGVQISDSSTTFTAAEATKRGLIAPDEVKTMGGIDKADVVGAKYAKRQVMNAMETAIATVILGKAKSATFDPAKLLGQTQTALEAVRLYEGSRVLISSTMVLKRIVTALLGDSKMGPIFSRLIAGTSPAIAASGMNLKAWSNALAIFLGVDEVLAGCDGVWNAAGTGAEKFGIAVIDNSGDELSHKWKPVLGKTYQFMPDGKQPYVIQTVADRVNINNIYDCFVWYNVKLLNTGALYTFDGVPA